MSTPRNTSTGRSRSRRAWSALAATAALVVAGAVSACADAPSAPGVAPAVAVPSLAKGGRSGSKPGQQQSGTTQDTVWPGTVLSTPQTATSLARLTPLADSVKARFFVTQAGGQYTVPGTGLSIYVPPYALPTDTLTLQVTALPGSVIAYHFGPHGTQFRKSLILWQDLQGTNYLSKGSTATYNVGYFGEESTVDQSRLATLIYELEQHFFDPENARIYWAVNHFSGYMVSWGLDRSDAL